MDSCICFTLLCDVGHYRKPDYPVDRIIGMNINGFHSPAFPVPCVIIYSYCSAAAGRGLHVWKENSLTASSGMQLHNFQVPVAGIIITEIVFQHTILFCAAEIMDNFIEYYSGLPHAWDSETCDKLQQEDIWYFEYFHFLCLVSWTAFLWYNSI